MSEEFKIRTSVGSFTGPGMAKPGSGSGGGDHSRFDIISHMNSISSEKRPDPKTDPDMIKPVGWRVLVFPLEPPERTKGGLIMPDESKQNFEYLSYVGEVIAMGPSCYKHPKFLKEYGGGEPWCKVGDWVAFGRYAGQDVRINGNRVRLVNDDEILGVAPNPRAILMYVQ